MKRITRRSWRTRPQFKRWRQADARPGLGGAALAATVLLSLPGEGSVAEVLKMLA